MKKHLLILSLFSTILLSNEQEKNQSKNYRFGCKVPDIIMQSILLTENGQYYPFYIRTNDEKSLNKFNSIAKKYTHNFPFKRDKMILDCKNKDNCVSMSIDLISNGITNLDLGLFQVNYNSFKHNLYTYFDKEFSYKIACKAVYEKIKITKKWDWRTVAAYHSLTKTHNERYLKQLVTNYNKLKEKQSENGSLEYNIIEAKNEINNPIKIHSNQSVIQDKKPSKQKPINGKEFFKLN